MDEVLICWKNEKILVCSKGKDLATSVCQGVSVLCNFLMEGIYYTESVIGDWWRRLVVDGLLGTVDRGCVCEMRRLGWI